jgi:hypothetical protein
VNDGNIIVLTDRLAVLELVWLATLPLGRVFFRVKFNRLTVVKFKLFSKR